MRVRALVAGLAVVASLVASLVAVPSAAVAEEASLRDIDVATTQRGIDFASVEAAGYSFAIVKAGGSQLSEGPYVSPYYTQQVDGARAAGIGVGHYWVSGDFASPTASADYLVDHLHDYRRGDVIALDDEVLDDSTRLWGDSEAAAFFDRVHARLGAYVPWFYVGAANLRAGTWAKTIATGAKLWVSVYGANDGGYPGAPNLGGEYPDWSAHQYTSVGSVGGIGAVDLTVAKPSAFTLVDGGGTTPPTGLPKTGTQQDGVPGTVFWQRAQKWLSLESGYTGPIDGAPGVNTYKALQRELAEKWAYTGPVDGVPGTATYAAWQRLAARHGYTGPIDGVMGPHSWRGVATFLNQDQWD